jgi:hypothetical protein
MTLQQIITTDQNLQLIQNNVNNALTPLQNQPMTGGVLLNNLSLISGQDNLIQHTLGRVPVIYFIGNFTVNTTVWSPTSSSLNGASSNALTINLRCSTSCNVSMWIN